MMNFQKYSIELADIMANHEMVGIDKGTKKPKACDEMSCRECEFDKQRIPSSGCAYQLIIWLFRDVRE